MILNKFQVQKVFLCDTSNAKIVYETPLGPTGPLETKTATKPFPV